MPARPLRIIGFLNPLTDSEDVAIRVAHVPSPLTELRPSHRGNGASAGVAPLGNGVREVFSAIANRV